MKKSVCKVLAILLVVFQLLAVMTIASAAAEVPATMDVSKTDPASITLDGKNTAGEAWDKVEWSTQKFRQIGGDPVPAGSDVRFKVLWGTSDGKAYLYFLIDVNDVYLNATSRAWYQDNVRVFIDEDGTCEDNVKPVRNDDNYGSKYASSEFMSYVPNSMTSKGFAYKATKKSDNSGYYIEMEYTFQNAALAVADAVVKANITVVFQGEDAASQSCAQFLWSFDSEKWSGGLQDKEYFAHAGSLKLSATEVKGDEVVEPTFAALYEIPKTDPASVTLDGAVTKGEAWDKVDVSDHNFRQIGGDPVPEGSDIHYKAMWGTKDGKAYLYFLIDVQDKFLNATGRAWNQDNVRVYIDEDGVGEDSAKPAINNENYGSVYASSEFMSYVPNSNPSKGFLYSAAKKADNSGYVIEVEYTFQNAALAVADGYIRVNLVAVFQAEDQTSCAQFLWSFDEQKWSVGNFKDKDYFAHAGALKLSETEVSGQEKDPYPASLDVCKTDPATMRLDGKRSTGEAWDKVEWAEKKVEYLEGQSAPEYSARFKSMWGTKDGKAYLYFLIDVDDSTLTATGRAWDQDNVRIFLDEDGIGEDNAKPVRNDAEYGSKYASSEFMSYVINAYSSKGFQYETIKKADESGYTIEVVYTFQNAALAVENAIVRANVNVVFANEDNTKWAMYLWCRDMDKWNGGLNDKEFFAHAGALKLSATEVKSDEEVPDDPVIVVPGNSVVAKQTNVNSVKIDGKVDAHDVWDQIEWTESALVYSTQPVATPGDPAYNEIYKDYDFKFKTLWAKDGSDAYVYFLIDVTDPNLSSDKNGWASDNIRIFLDETGNAASGTLAARVRENTPYYSSEFMSYASMSTNEGYKYRAAQKKDQSGYIIEVQYTLADASLAAAGHTMQLNVVGCDADAANDDGAHYATQKAWSYKEGIWGNYPKIDFVDHAGSLVLSDDQAVLENKTTDPVEETTTPAPTDEDVTPGNSTETEPTTEKPAAKKKGCGSSLGLVSVLPAVAIAGVALIRRKKKED